MDGKIIITKQEYADLLKDSEELQRLNCGGVDNWDGYSESLNPDWGEDLSTAKKEIDEKVKQMESVA